MTPFMLALLTTVVPVLVWLFTLSEARSLAKARSLAEFKGERHEGRGTRLAIFLLAYWPFLFLPVLVPLAMYRLMAAELPPSSWTSIALIVFGPMLFALWMFRTDWKA